MTTCTPIQSRVPIHRYICSDIMSRNSLIFFEGNWVGSGLLGGAHLIVTYLYEGFSVLIEDDMTVLYCIIVYFG